MKANELQIGDLIQNTNGNIGRVIGFQFYQVSERNEVVIRYHSNSTCWSEEQMLKPIPLTTEMLEKWGWEVKHPEDKKHTYWVIRRDGGSILVHKNLGFVYADISGKPHQDGFFCPHFHGHLYYAHELQHALRLCGLHELADNFKV